MKQLPTLIVLLLISIAWQHADAAELSLGSADMSTGENATLNLSLSGTDSFAGVNAKILFPKGIRVTRMVPGDLPASDFIMMIIALFPMMKTTVSHSSPTRPRLLSAAPVL